MDKLDNILGEIEKRHKPLIVGISGFGGAGKSTLAKMLAEKTNGIIIGIDSFWKSIETEDYNMWEVVDYGRLIDEVLVPFRAGKSVIRYREFDWEKGQIGEWKEISRKEILIIEGVGLFRPEVLKYIDYSIWIGRSIEESIRFGKKRDKEEYGIDNDRLWDGVWKRNDLECFEKYNPFHRADCVWAWGKNEE